MPKVALGPDPMHGGGNVPKEVPPLLIIIEACPLALVATATVVRAAGNKTLNSGPPGLGVFIIPYGRTKSKKTKKPIDRKHADRAGTPSCSPSCSPSSFSLD